MTDMQDPSNPYEGPRISFKSWSDRALEGYVIMVREQVSSSIFPTGRAYHQAKLNDALDECVKRRESAAAAQAVQNHGEVVMKERVNRIYQDTHATSDADPESKATKDGD